MSDLFGYEKPQGKTMGMIMADGINNNIREENDFYPTIDQAETRAIIEYMDSYLAAKMEAGEVVLFREPACVWPNSAKKQNN